MQMATRKEYLSAMRERYQNASRWEKSQLLNEVIAVLQIHRKHAVRTLNRRELNEPCREGGHTNMKIRQMLR